jgi:hypothetical protein
LNLSRWRGQVRPEILSDRALATTRLAARLLSRNFHKNGSSCTHAGSLPCVAKQQSASTPTRWGQFFAG